METRNRFRLQFIGIALGVLAALMIWPGTRWLVRSQASYLIPDQATASSWSAGVTGLKVPRFKETVRAMHNYALTRPEDFTIQLADAVTYSPSGDLNYTQKVANLRELATRFPDRAAVYANILRFSTQGPVMVHRREDGLFVSRYDRPFTFTPRAVEPGLLEAYDRDAAEGERLDPDNAFFPLMRAIGLLRAERDSEALAALHRAAQKPLWQEYYEDEVDGEMKLQTGAFGRTGVLDRVGIYSAVLLPQYAQLRSVARISVALAAKDEQSGRADKGIAIREDVMRVGGLIRAESHTLIGSLVGSAVALIGMQCPGGAPMMEGDPHKIADRGKQSGSSGEKSVPERLLEQYDEFLQRTGHMEQSARAHGEVVANAEVKEIAHLNQRSDLWGPALQHLCMCWWTEIVLLNGAVWTLAIGAFAALCYRSRRMRSGQGLPKWASRGLPFGAAAAVLSGATAYPAGVPATSLWLTSVLLFAAVVAALPAASAIDRLRSLGAYLIGLAGTGGLILLFAWQSTAAVDPIHRIVMMINGTLTEGAQSPEPNVPTWLLSGINSDLLFHLVTVAATACVPLLVGTAFIIISRVNRVPVSVALVRGFRGCAVPIAGALILAYAVSMPMTVRQEADIDQRVGESMRHEGKYIAASAGREWPGRIP